MFLSFIWLCCSLNNEVITISFFSHYLKIDWFLNLKILCLIISVMGIKFYNLRFTHFLIF